MKEGITMEREKRRDSIILKDYVSMRKKLFIWRISVTIAFGGFLLMAKSPLLLAFQVGWSGSLSFLHIIFSNKEEKGVFGYGCEDGDFSSAKFKYPQSIIMDSEGDLIVPDYSTIRRISLSSRNVVTIAGNQRNGFRFHYKTIWSLYNSDTHSPFVWLAEMELDRKLDSNQLSRYA